MNHRTFCGDYAAHSPQGQRHLAPNALLAEQPQGGKNSPLGWFVPSLTQLPDWCCPSFAAASARAQELKAIAGSIC